MLSERPELRRLLDRKFEPHLTTQCQNYSLGKLEPSTLMCCLSTNILTVALHGTPTIALCVPSLRSSGRLRKQYIKVIH